MRNWDMNNLCMIMLMIAILVMGALGVSDVVATHRERMALIERMSPEDAKAALEAGK